jgi:hypothetical protein
MTITETVLVFVGIPLAIAGVLALLVFGASARRAPRYRPGRPFAFTPVWFLAAPEPGQAATGHHTLPASSAPALEATRTTGADAADATGAAATRPGSKKGGARGTW